MIVLVLIAMVCFIGLLVIGCVAAYYKAMSLIYVYQIQRISKKIGEKVKQWEDKTPIGETNIVDQKAEGCDEMYSHAQLVSFGKFLLSKERTNNLKANWKEGDSVLFEERLREVYHADICNWREKIGLK